ncbi:GvpL/GvpF family gas vesicle protein [Actinomycetes bacterium KLBMP 9759]
MSPRYVYGLVPAGAAIPEGLAGLGPSGQVTTIEHGRVAAVVGDVPVDRPLGTRDDLIAHETVLDTLAARTAVLPMRFPAVVEERGVVDELLGPNEEFFASALADLEGRVQFTLRARYEQDVVLREIVESDAEVRELQERVRGVPEDASYYDRVRLGELIVAAMERRREGEAAQVFAKLEPLAVRVAAHQPTSPDEVVNAAFLIERDGMAAFDAATEDVGREHAGRLRLRLLGPLAPYDFAPAE